jgi:hypothetical protein
MKKYLSNPALVLMFAFVVMTVLSPEVAYAGNSMRGNLNTLIQNTFFKGAIDLGLIIVAAWNWFSYFANFDPKDAFMKAIVPGILTFLAFQWVDVLRWVQLV